jgi:hypothetical protein
MNYNLASCHPALPTPIDANGKALLSSLHDPSALILKTCTQTWIGFEAAHASKALIFVPSLLVGNTYGFGSDCTVELRIWMCSIMMIHPPCH